MFFYCRKYDGKYSQKYDEKYFTVYTLQKSHEYEYKMKKIKHTSDANTHTILDYSLNMIQ